MYLRSLKVARHKPNPRPAVHFTMELRLVRISHRQVGRCLLDLSTLGDS